MIDYNLVLYVGIAFYALIFITFIVYQMHDRKLDKEQWLSDQLTKSFNKAKDNQFEINADGTETKKDSIL
jgi:hypothetical protein